MGPSGTIA